MCVCVCEREMRDVCVLCVYPSQVVLLGMCFLSFIL